MPAPQSFFSSFRVYAALVLFLVFSRLVPHDKISHCRESSTSQVFLVVPLSCSAVYRRHVRTPPRSNSSAHHETSQVQSPNSFKIQPDYHFSCASSPVSILYLKVLSLLANIFQRNVRLSYPWRPFRRSPACPIHTFSGFTRHLSSVWPSAQRRPLRRSPACPSRTFSGCTYQLSSIWLSSQRRPFRHVPACPSHTFSGCTHQLSSVWPSAQRRPFRHIPACPSHTFSGCIYHLTAWSKYLINLSLILDTNLLLVYLVPRHPGNSAVNRGREVRRRGYCCGASVNRCRA